MKEFLNKFLNENASGNIKSTAKVLNFHERKPVTALQRFPCFRNLSDYDVNMKVLLKLQLAANFEIAAKPSILITHPLL